MSRCLIATGLASSRFAPDLLPQPLLQQAAEMGDKRRQQYLAGRALLAAVMHDHFGCAALPEIQLSPNGKPAFCDPALPYFSLSHSRQHLLVAICPTGDVGCDIEALRPRASMLALAQELFSPPENQWLRQQGEHLEAAFWQLWTLREARLKQEGGSVWQMASLSLDPLRQPGSSSPSEQLMSWMTVDSAIALALPPGIKQIEVFSADASGQLLPSSAKWQPFSLAD